MLRILLSNDDGILAPGIKILGSYLKQIAEVFVIAPDRNRSGASNSLTLENPIRIRNLENGEVSVEGTPTDCVHLGLTGILDFRPDLVVSGINEGANLGDDVWYSGTVAAAMEGRILGLPALAISLTGKTQSHYQTAAEVAKNLVLRMMSSTPSENTILNVNVPDVSLEELKGYEVTRLGTRHQAETTIKTKDPRGHAIYWVGEPGPTQDAGEGTDFYAVSQNKVSITPLCMDITHYQSLDELSQWMNGIEQ